MKKRTKIIIIVCILLVILAIAIFNLLVYLDRKVGIHTFTIAEISDKLIYAGNVFGGADYSFNFDDIILQDENLNEIDKSSVSQGGYVYLYLKEDEYNFHGNTTYYCKINTIDNNQINVEMPEWKFYIFFTENAKIKDINGKKIDSSNLKVGDTVKVINIIPNYINDDAMTYEGSSCSSIDNVKSIQIIETDEETKNKLANRNMLAIKTAIVASVKDDYLCVVDNQNLLYNVYYPKDGNRDFKMGQEVKIYFNGKCNNTGRNGINEIENVGRIDIIDETNRIIPDEILKRFNTNFDNVEVSLNNLSNTEISLTVTDKNDIKYNITNNYTISKDISEKPDKNFVEYDDGSIAILPYEGEKWQELTKISGEEENIGNIETIDENTKKYTFDWKDIYGNLESGEYKFSFGELKDNPNDLWYHGYDRDSISVKFTVDEEGKVTDYKIYKGY